MGGSIHSESSQAACEAWQQSNPTEPCEWTSGCFSWYIEKAGDSPHIAGDSCVDQTQQTVGSSFNPPSVRPKKHGCPNNTLLWVGIGILAVGLLIVCQRSQGKK